MCGGHAYALPVTIQFLGAPVQLFSTLGTGVKDFFYEPAAGVVQVRSELALYVRWSFRSACVALRLFCSALCSLPKHLP